MSTESYYINEEESRAAKIVGSGSSFTARIYDGESVLEEEFETFADAEHYVMSSLPGLEGWVECNEDDFDRMLVHQEEEKDRREEEEAILEDWYPGFTTDDDFDDFPSFMSD